MNNVQAVRLVKSPVKFLGGRAECQSPVPRLVCSPSSTDSMASSPSPVSSPVMMEGPVRFMPKVSRRVSVAIDRSSPAFKMMEGILKQNSKNNLSDMSKPIAHSYSDAEIAHFNEPYSDYESDNEDVERPMSPHFRQSPSAQLDGQVKGKEIYSATHNGTKYSLQVMKK